MIEQLLINIGMPPLENPRWLLLIPISILLLFFIIRANIVQIPLDIDQKKKRRKARITIYVSRVLVIALIALALATPLIQVEEERSGNPELTLLIDESTSMNVLDTDFVSSLQEILEQQIPTRTRVIAQGDTSRLGDAILDNLEPGRQIVLITDGYATSGTSLEDVALFAQGELDATISAINLEERHRDASIFIEGPNTVVAETTNTFTIRVTATHDDPLPIRVTLNGQTVFDETTADRAISFSQEFSAGEHRIEARIQEPDHWLRNNVFYKRVTALEKPHILLLSQTDSPLDSVLNELYTVTKRATLPADLSPYYAIVSNDVPASQFTNTQALHDFLIDEEGDFFGGGLVAIGGFNSFDRGNYRGSAIENFLPVTVGRGEPVRGNDNIVILLHVSSATTGVRMEQVCDGFSCELVEVIDERSVLDIIKAQAVNLISSERNILATNRVGVIAFGADATVQSRDQRYERSDSIRVIEPLDYLYNNRENLQQNIPRLVGGGPSEIGLAFRSAYDMLQDAPQGDNNYILLLTNGAVAPNIQQEALSAVSNLNRLGVEVFVYGVGRDERNINEEFLQEIARRGDGLYEGPVFTTSNVNPARISIQWGDPEQKGFGDSFSLIPFSLTHFITRDLELTATLNGFNQVAPRSNARTLVTTDFGQPALTTMNYGTGRVAALTVFTGSGLGELLNEENSLLLTRTINWAIGDPQRKQTFFVDIEDARINQSTRATIRSEQPLQDDNVDFSRSGDMYTASFTPTSLGFNQFFGALYATNYNKEFQYLGMNPQLESITRLAGGRMFGPDDVDQIIEHVNEVSRQIILQDRPVRWPFIALAITIFLTELLIRRLYLK